MSPWTESRHDVHTVVTHPPGEGWLGQARHRDLTLGVAAGVLEVVGLFDGGGLVVFPAGYLRAPSVDVADVLAQEMLGLSRRAEVGVIFGLDVCAETGDEWAPLCPPAISFAFACEAGRPIAWPARQVAGGERAKESASEQRCLPISGRKVGLLLGGEVFNDSLRRELAGERPDTIVVLTHCGPTSRWRAALESLREIAPVVLAGEASNGWPSWAAPPAGWSRTDLGGTPSITLSRYRPMVAAEAEIPMGARPG